MQSTRRVLWRAHSNIDQHCDLRPSRTIRESKDFYKYRNRLTSHSPYEIAQGIVSIFTGIVTENKAKAYATCSTGKLAADAITGNNYYADTKLKINDRVVSISME